ncbi:MAG: RsmE family RNA methyltransferase, partial [Elusimicrobia bacterium]|nr:RsmE family RNA methyltransferase [Elusimicrobiota bacterium]
MPQFFVAPEEVRAKSFRLTGPEAFHVTKVLRLAPGAELELFDGKGGRFSGVIEAVDPDGGVRGRLTATLAEGAERAAARVHLHLGLLKASHWDYALEKAAELGAASIEPLLTPRTVVLLHEVERARAKRERWARVVMAASKQCGRAELPLVREPRQFRDALADCRGKGPVLLAWEGRRGASAAPVLRGTLAE